MYKLYRGTNFTEAQALGEGYQHKPTTAWSESLERAKSYSTGAVIKIQLDELPLRFENYKVNVFKEYEFPIDYYENDGGIYCHTETSKVLLAGLDY